MLKKFLLLFTLLIFVSANAVFAQEPTRPARTTANTQSEAQAFEAARNETDLEKKIAALKKFAADFQKSPNRQRALESLVVSRAQLADAKLRSGDGENALKLFTDAVAEAPTPISPKLFAEIIVQFPTNLFYGGQQAAANEIAKQIEDKIGNDSTQLLALAAFYLATENAAQARRVAQKVISSNPSVPSAYQTLGFSYRLEFDLEEAEKAYAKALELDANSVISKRSLAEMKRALGKSGEAINLYRELAEKNPEDLAAQTGLTLSTFDAGKRAEAETLFNTLIEKNPANFPLLTSAAYWYAAQNEGAKAVELAQKAIAVEPRYAWTYVALSRGLLAQSNPLEAEKAVVTARQFGSFPTLDYELAVTRIEAGFFQDAADILRQSFKISDGVIETKLGRRIEKKAADFTELLALERRASIFNASAADNLQTAARAKSLLQLTEKISAADATETEINQAVDDFTSGSDKMKTFRQLYAANLLLREKKSIAKVIEITRDSIKGVDNALTAASPQAAAVADELYDGRNAAFAKGEIVVIPDIPRQTISAIIRGKIEETLGWAFYQQGNTADAVTRLKRAVSILPEKSAMWRSSMWRLGTALEAGGDSKAALDFYLKSYTSGQPDLIRRTTVEGIYRKVNGNLDGLEKIIGEPLTAQVSESAPTPAVVVEKTENASPEAVKTESAKQENPSSTIIEIPKATETPAPIAEPKIETPPAAAPAEAPAILKNNEESCLVLGEEKVTVLNQSGGIGLFVGFKEKNDPSVISFENSQPNDIEVVRDPQIGSLTNRAFFLVKSISSKVGEYAVTFKSPCGNRQLKITVR